MADVFLSYAREDLGRVHPIATTLESHGWTVFWDRHIPHGRDFIGFIQEQLDDARCVIVAWSKASIGSQFVRDEADEGNRRLALVPLLLDEVRPPLGFRQLQTANLTDWNGDASHEEFSRFVSSVRSVVSASSPGKTPARAAPREPLSLPRKFSADVYVSYASLDNIPLIPERKGWVSNFVRALEVRSAQLLGRQITVCWDPLLEDKIPFAERTLEQLHDVTAFVSIVSNNLAHSKWAARELAEFCEAAESNGGLHVGSLSRVFKVMKSPVSLDRLPSELQSVLGYEFFKMDPVSGTVRDLDEIFGPEAQREFWLRLDDLAHDFVDLLVRMESEAGPSPSA